MNIVESKTIRIPQGSITRFVAVNVNLELSYNETNIIRKALQMYNPDSADEAAKQDAMLQSLEVMMPNGNLRG